MTKLWTRELCHSYKHDRLTRGESGEYFLCNRDFYYVFQHPFHAVIARFFVTRCRARSLTSEANTGATFSVLS
ncbi:hypothetical protein SERLA73DRAFT_141504 [Serpula lacrymans var. lacrymans S7.3]|uniref:Uncharacterized protein n=1 Tax=Serpula lacrymans var. lacrymans (strain S7.3) TaxID=936435 RepID=F8Q6H6_SERL3|nr:hypothetical protein SERLA73DRAFT_141504 [Serpula lacrymans var. lacrymans S7.3]